jgi:group I intron endonuclease
MTTYTIYIATNTVNNKVYIGFDSKWPNRVANHKCSSKKEDTKFYRAIRKHGFSNFQFSILYQSKEKTHTLEIMEPFFISEYDSFSSGYNSTFGGGGTIGNTGYKKTEESKINQKLAVTGKKQSYEHIKKRISASVITRKTSGYTPSAETIQKSINTKIRNGTTGAGVPKSPEHISNMKCHSNNSTMVECPHCSKVGQLTNMKAWHFDRCKLSPNYISTDTTCPHCNITGPSRTMKRHHFDQCKTLIPES